MSAASNSPPASSSFPTSISDLYITDPATATNLYSTLRTLRRSTLSIPNRMRSIISDANYVTDIVHPSFPSLPVLANERCGSWYIPPNLKSGSAYFKSTDGHHGQWDFSLRRLNLSVLESLGKDGGAVLVDTTRRGKRMPDALRRTVPVWTLVWNRILFPELKPQEGEREHWAWRLQHPGLEPSEVRMIEVRANGWIEGLRGLGLDFEALRKKLAKPIRCRWVVRGEDFECEGGEGDLDANNDNGHNTETKSQPTPKYNLFVLCSASRRVLGAEMSEDGYIQGAGDDAEGWSRGLTPTIFWKHKDQLLTMPEEELPELIKIFVKEQQQQEVGESSSLNNALRITPTRNVFIGVASTVAGFTEGRAKDAVFDLTISCNAKETDGPSSTLNLGCRSGKLGSRDLRWKLASVYTSTLDVVKKNGGARILVICENGRDLSIGAATALLCLLYDDDGNLDTSKAKSVDKQLIKKRLVWISSLKPDANPSRSTLQSVNAFLMERPP